MPRTDYYWDALSDNVLMEEDENGVVVASYEQEPSLYGEVITQERAGQTSYYHFDGQDSTRALTDGSEDVSDTYTYSAYGAEVAATGSTVNTYRYKGGLGYDWWEEVAAMYVRARTLDPDLGRWLSVDPLFLTDKYYGVIEAGEHKYTYARNSPLSHADPGGRQAGGSVFGPILPPFAYPPSGPPTTPPLGNIDQGRRDLRELERRLREMCKTCCKDTEFNIKDCDVEARRKARLLLAFWEQQFGLGWNRGRDNRGGFLCWEWSFWFDAIVNLEEFGSCLSSTEERVRCPVRSWETVHYYIRINVCGKTTDECTILLDDGFYPDEGLIHGPEWPDPESHWPLIPTPREDRIRSGTSPVPENRVR